MSKYIIDTNIYIDFYNTGKFKEIIYQKKYPEIIYVSSVVIMELLAGAFIKENHAIIANLIKTAHARAKIISPSQNDFFEAGKILAKLQSETGYDLKKAYSITNDVLIALSARRWRYSSNTK
ncbi:PIN domain-containing protein [candidate division KSB1 bacterium]|nr:PIN domain-containing protein [candidate division KSB1 bacterium]